MTVVRNKRTLITGAGHGLGKALARQFAEAGAEVIVSDRDPDRVAATVRELAEARPWWNRKRASSVRARTPTGEPGIR